METLKAKRISLSINEKKEMLRLLCSNVNCVSVNTPETVPITVANLTSCFSSDPEVILLSFQVLDQLMSSDKFKSLAVDIFQKILCYLPFMFQNRDGSMDEKTETIQFLTKFLERFEQQFNENLQSDAEFPFTMLIHLTQLICGAADLSDKPEVLDLALQIFNLLPRLPEQQQQPGTKCKLINTFIATISNLIQKRQDSKLTVSSNLLTLANRLMEIFLIPNPDERHPGVEIRLTGIYSQIFDLLLDDVTQQNPKAVELLLTNLYSFLVQELNLDLKLNVVRDLLGRGRGLCDMFKRLYNLTTANPDQLIQFKTVSVEILTHFVWEFEVGSSNDTFHQLKSQIREIVFGVDWPEVIESGFLICFLDKRHLSAVNLWFILLVRYFEANLLGDDEAGEDCTLQANGVFNLTTLLSVCCLKQFQMPKFLLKYVLETTVKFHQHDVFKRNESIHYSQLRQLVVAPTRDLPNMFGLLPASVPRLKWFSHFNLPWRAEFIHRQQVEALGEYLLPLNSIDSTLVEHFPRETLVSVLCSKESSPTAQTNASIILSRVELPEALLARIIDGKLTNKNNSKRGSKWSLYLRAIYGSLGGGGGGGSLSDENRTKLVAFLSRCLKVGGMDPICSILVIDSLTRIFTAKELRNAGTDFGTL